MNGYSDCNSETSLIDQRLEEARHATQLQHELNMCQLSCTLKEQRLEDAISAAQLQHILGICQFCCTIVALMLWLLVL